MTTRITALGNDPEQAILRVDGQHELLVAIETTNPNTNSPDRKSVKFTIHGGPIDANSSSPTCATIRAAGITEPRGLTFTDLPGSAYRFTLTSHATYEMGLNGHRCSSRTLPFEDSALRAAMEKIGTDTSAHERGRRARTGAYDDLGTIREQVEDVQSALRDTWEEFIASEELHDAIGKFFGDGELDRLRRIQMALDRHDTKIDVCREALEHAKDQVLLAQGEMATAEAERADLTDLLDSHLATLT